MFQIVGVMGGKNANGTKLMNHWILCAEKCGGKIMHRSEKRTGEVVKTMHWKTMPATGKYLITHIRTVFVFVF